MRLRYWILTGIVVISLIVAMVFSSYGAWPEDAPTGTLTVMITEVDSGQVWTATTELEPLPLTQTIFGENPVPFTTYTPEVPPLEPNGEYVITFAVTTHIGNPEEISLITWEMVKITSQNVVHSNVEFFTDSGGDNNLQVEMENIDPETPTSFSLPPFTRMKILETGEITALLGKHINNSTYLLRINVHGIDANGHPAEHTQISADIVISVQEPTEMVLIVDDVSATVTGAGG